MRFRPALLLLALLLLAGVFASQAGAASVRWRFEVDGQYILHRPAVAPDGSVAVAGSSGRLYSLTPQGALRWSVPAVGGDGGPSIGPDGTVYVGRDSRVTAVAPDGTIRWTFVDSGQSVMAGPTVGPDGNIYVVFDIGGLGAVALSPAGQLLWSNPGNPTFLEYGQLGAEIVFDSESLYVAFDEYGVAPTSMLYRLTLDGAQDWAVPVPISNDIFMQRQAQPAIGPDGALYLTGLNSQQGWLLVRFNRDSGSVVWTYTRDPANGMSRPAVGPDGSVYLSRSLGFLDAVNPAGDGRWTYFDESIIDYPDVTPNGALVVAGDRPNFGEPGRVRGWNAVNGALTFQVELPTGDSGYQVVYTGPRFTPDSTTAYVGTATFYRPETSFIYALDLGAATATATATTASSSTTAASSSSSTSTSAAPSTSTSAAATATAATTATASAAAATTASASATTAAATPAATPASGPGVRGAQGRRQDARRSPREDPQSGLLRRAHPPGLLSREAWSRHRPEPACRRSGPSRYPSPAPRQPRALAALERIGIEAQDLACVVVEPGDLVAAAPETESRAR